METLSTLDERLARLPRRQRDARILFDVRIPMRDGVELSANLYLPPEGDGPAPVLCTRTPYTAHYMHAWASTFARHGYPTLVVDVRGRGNSDGTFLPMLQERADGHDTIEWIARQSFCNGKVGMWGGSYSGYDQWVTAAARPQHLAAIAPTAAPFAGVDVPFRNNVPKPYILQWLAYVAGKSGPDRIFADSAYWRGRFCEWFESGTAFIELDDFLGLHSPTFRSWMRHCEQGSYWTPYNPAPCDYARIDLPILSITGMCDADQPGSLAHYRAHRSQASAAAKARHFLVMGPWDHPGTRDPQSHFLGIDAEPESLVDLKALHLEWFDWTLRDGVRPGFLEANTVYYVLGAGEWRRAEDIDGATGHHELLALGSTGDAATPGAAGTLGACQAQAQVPDLYVHDPLDVSLARLETGIDPEDRSDDTLFQARAGRQFVFTGPALNAPADICGFFDLTLWLSIDQPDTDVRAWIHELRADGSVILLTYDTVRARYREDLGQSRLIESCEPLEYRFARFPFVAKRLDKGSCLRLTIGPLHSIYAQKNYNSAKPVSLQTAGDAHTVSVTLLHDREHPSALRVPIADKDR